MTEYGYAIEVSATKYDADPEGTLKQVESMLRRSYEKYRADMPEEDASVAPIIIGGWERDLDFDGIEGPTTVINFGWYVNTDPDTPRPLMFIKTMEVSDG